MSINSNTDICNLALDLLSAGTVQDIENPTSATEELLARWYGQSRRKVLREHPWNFAIKRQILSPSSTAPAFGYSKAFPVPSDFIRIVYVATDLVSDGDVVLSPENYQVEGNNLLISNTFGDASQLKLVYVSDFKTVSQFDPMFIDLLAYEIAISIAYKVTESNTNIQRVTELHKQRAALAKAIDGQERPPVRVERSRSKHVRRNNHSTRDSHRIIF